MRVIGRLVGSRIAGEGTGGQVIVGRVVMFYRKTVTRS